MNKMKIGFPESGAAQQGENGSEVVEGHSGSGNKKYSLDFLYSLRNNASSIIPLSPVSQLCQLMKWTSLSTNRRIFNEDQPQRLSNAILFGNAPNTSTGGVIFPNPPTANPARHSISGASGVGCGRSGVRFGSEDFLSKTNEASGDSLGKSTTNNSSLLGTVPPPSSVSSTSVGGAAYRPASTHLNFLSFPPSSAKDPPLASAECGPVVDPVPAGGGSEVTSGSASAPPPPPLRLNSTSPVVAGRLSDFKMTAAPPDGGEFGWPPRPQVSSARNPGAPCLPTPNTSSAGAMRQSAGGRAALGNLNLPCDRTRQQHDQLFGTSSSPEPFEMGGSSNYAHAQGHNGRLRQGASPNNWNEQDLWDSPMEGGAGGDIFTLGDIKQAERMIESQGISADMYLDLETRRVLKDQQLNNLRRRPLPNGNSPLAQQVVAVPQDIFFGDDPPGSPPYARQTSAAFGSVSPTNHHSASALRGESRFLSMFNRPLVDSDSSPSLPTQILDHDTQLRPSNATNQPPPIDRVALDKALVREHLLRLIGANTPSSVTFPASPPANRGTLTFSKPMNPAAPNFAPSGLFHAYDAVPGSPTARNIPPPPPADYRRSEPPPSATNQLNWLRRENVGGPQRNCYPAHHGAAPASEGQTVPPTPTGAQEIYDLIQRWVAKQRQTTAAAQQQQQGSQQQQQGSQQPVADAATLALQSLIQKQLANRTKPMTPEAIARYNGLLAQYLNRTKAATTTRSGMIQPTPAARKAEPTITNQPPPMQQPFQGSAPATNQSNLINQQIAAIQAVLQQQLLGAGGGGGAGSACSSPSQSQQPANSRKQIAFLLQTWKKLKAAQAQTATSSPPPNRQISLSSALEQITAKHQANGNAPSAAAVPRPQQHVPNKTGGQMQSRPGLLPPVTRLTPSGLPPGLGNGPPPGMGGNQATGPKSLEAARAQLSALLKDLVAQGGKSQALTALLKKTTPGHAQAIQQQIQTLLQQRANGSNKEGGQQHDSQQTTPADAQSSSTSLEVLSSTEQQPNSSSANKENFEGGGTVTLREAVQNKLVVSMPEDAFGEGGSGTGPAPRVMMMSSGTKTFSEEPLA